MAVALLAGLQACTARPGDQLRAAPGEDGFAQEAFVIPIGKLGSADLAESRHLRAVATTSIVGDVVGQVGGEAVELTIMLPAGADPHSYVATPRQLAEASDADVVFLNGFGLEEGLGGILEELSTSVPMVSISEGVTGMSISEQGEAPEHDAAGVQPDLGEARHAHAGIDPHVWFDPTIVMQWTRNAAAALSALDPASRGGFQANAEGYLEQLGELDIWIAKQIAAIPPTDRVLVTDHLELGYFARRYGFDIVGAVIPAYSSGAAPSPQDMAELLAAIETRAVNAVFVGATANPDAAQAVAREAGIRVIVLYTGSLSEPGGPADSYLRMMEYDVGAIAASLR